MQKRKEPKQQQQHQQKHQKSSKLMAAKNVNPLPNINLENYVGRFVMKSREKLRD